MEPGRARLLLAGQRVARLATTGASGQPHVVPVCFAVLDDVVVTAVDHKPKSTRDLHRLRDIRENPRVALLADHYEEDWSQLWWVRADGRAEIAPASAEALEALVAKYRHYRDRPPAGPFVLITVTRWVAWEST